MTGATMADSTSESERILRNAGSSLAEQRAGGHHRRAGRSGQPIGRESAAVRRRNLATRIKLIVAAMLVILGGAVAAGIVLNGIGFAGVMMVIFAAVLATIVFANFPRVKTPRKADLARTRDARQLVARTELWLEQQRPALPAPAVGLVDAIGVQLDALGLQLETVDPAHPAAAETRKLVGEYLPDMVDSYRKIPATMRGEKRAGQTPEEQLSEGLSKISGEIDRVTRQIADGALDDLAVRTRYLEYKYGDGPSSPQETG